MVRWARRGQLAKEICTHISKFLGRIAVSRLLLLHEYLAAHMASSICRRNIINRATRSLRSAIPTTRFGWCPLRLRKRTSGLPSSKRARDNHPATLPPLSCIEFLAQPLPPLLLHPLNRYGRSHIAMLSLVLSRNIHLPQPGRTRRFVLTGVSSLLRLLVTARRLLASFLRRAVSSYLSLVLRALPCGLLCSRMSLVGSYAHTNGRGSSPSQHLRIIPAVARPRQPCKSCDTRRRQPGLGDSRRAILCR